MDSISSHALFPRRIRDDIYSFHNKEESCTDSVPCVVSALSSLLERVVKRNERIAALSCSPSFNKTKYESFNGVEVPDMSIQHYLERIFKYIHCSPSVFVVAYAYIDRLIHFHSQLLITSQNVHRILITSVMVASKFVEDLNFKNSHYGRVGGFSTEEMNRLEIEFLFLLNFKLQVTVNVFESYCCYLEREVAFGRVIQIERSISLLCVKDEQSA